MKIEKGINIYNERTLHAALKSFIEPDKAFQEVPYKGYIADIKNESGIVEIQTRQLGRLRDKLRVFLAEDEVTVVHPIITAKRLIYIDPESGEIVSNRKSPKKESLYTALHEIYAIKMLLDNPRLTLRLINMEVTEYRKYKKSSSAKARKRSERAERIPFSIGASTYLGGKYGFSAMLPSELPEIFTSKDYAAAAGIPRETASTALNILTYVNAVERIGKSGNSIVYRLIAAKP